MTYHSIILGLQALLADTTKVLSTSAGTGSAEGGSGGFEEDEEGLKAQGGEKDDAAFLRDIPDSCRSVRTAGVAPPERTFESHRTCVVTEMDSGGQRTAGPIWRVDSSH